MWCILSAFKKKNAWKLNYLSKMWFKIIDAMCFHNFKFFLIFLSYISDCTSFFFPLSTLQNSSAAQDPPVSDTADLLGLNSDPQPPTNTSPAAPLGFQAGMKAASSNSDLLNDLFAPPAGQSATTKEDIFFSGAASDSKRTDLISHCHRLNVFGFFFLIFYFFLPLLLP